MSNLILFVSLLIVHFGCLNKKSDKFENVDALVVKEITDQDITNQSNNEVNFDSSVYSIEIKEHDTKDNPVKDISIVNKPKKVENLNVPKNKSDKSKKTHESGEVQIDSNLRFVESTLPVQESEPIIHVKLDQEKDLDAIAVKEPVKKDDDSKPMLMENDLWQSILDKFVSNSGVVDYAGLKKEESSLDEYLGFLKKSTPGKLDKSKKAKAFWINAYNSFTVKLILNNYPVQSIMDIDNGNPWDTKWIELGGSKYSLNNIEHDILRVLWDDARIHFAVNCAAKSCPPLSNQSFTAENMNGLLDQLTKKFVNNNSFNQLSSSSISLSKIFEWYAEDFGDVTDFLADYTTVKIDSEAKVRYNDYEWALNGK